MHLQNNRGKRIKNIFLESVVSKKKKKRELDKNCLPLNGNTEEFSIQNYVLQMLGFHNESEILFEYKAWQKFNPKLNMQLLASRL